MTQNRLYKICNEDGWYHQWNKATVHFFFNEKVLCNQTHAMNEKKLIQVNEDYSKKFCKKCKQVIQTYSNLNNYFPKPKPRYSIGERL